MPPSVLITGGAQRIGRELALAFARQGASICITYRHSAEQANDTVADLEAAGARRAAVVYCDLDDPASIQATVEGASVQLGELSVVVNNAGAFASAPLESLTVEQWDEMFRSNTRGPFLVSQAALPHLRAFAARTGAPGRIIHLGSLGGEHAWATHAHYCSSKAALHMLTRSMAKAWAPQVVVNCVAPGMIAATAEDDDPHFSAKTPMARNGRAADVAEAVLFFAQSTPFITGQVLTVDGGLGL
jgi:NAD(P)-dependent dehydrogenase (short-subunit alcohol dehydrogenase family)